MSDLNIEAAVLAINAGEGDGSTPVERMISLTSQLTRLAEQVDGSFQISVSNYEWCSEVQVRISVSGPFGKALAEGSDVTPSNWYGFESDYRGEERGMPQRNWEWKAGGVSFIWIESTRDCGVSFEEAARQHAERVEAEELAASIRSPE